MPRKVERTPSSNYRKPPVEHQFKKGTSGNQKGRPRKEKDIQPGFGALGGGIADRLASMALDEATRPVTVREGDKVSEIPAMQALFRTMFRAAAQGDTKAGHQLLEVITQAEGARARMAVELLQFAAEYKERYTPMFDKCEREGRDPPEIYPHPDDVIIDNATAEVTIDGPDSKEQAAAQKALLQHASKMMARYVEVEAALAKDPANRELRLELKQLKTFYDFLKKESERVLRRKAMREARRTLEPKPQKPKDNPSDQA